MNYKQRGMNAFLKGLINFHFETEDEIKQFCSYCNAKNIFWRQGKSKYIFSVNNFDIENLPISLYCYQFQGGYEIKYSNFDDKTQSHCNLFIKEDVLRAIEYSKSKNIDKILREMEEIKNEYIFKLSVKEEYLIMLNEL